MYHGNARPHVPFHHLNHQLYSVEMSHATAVPEITAPVEHCQCKTYGYYLMKSCRLNVYTEKVVCVACSNSV